MKKRRLISKTNLGLNGFLVKPLELAAETMLIFLIVVFVVNVSREGCLTSTNNIMKAADEASSPAKVEFVLLRGDRKVYTQGLSLLLLLLLPRYL